MVCLFKLVEKEYEGLGQFKVVEVVFFHQSQTHDVCRSEYPASAATFLVGDTSFQRKLIVEDVLVRNHCFTVKQDISHSRVHEYCLRELVDGRVEILFKGVQYSGIKLTRVV